MYVRCFGSSSKGNCYALYSDNGKILLLDAGLPRKDILTGIDFDMADVDGCLVSHGHS